MDYEEKYEKLVNLFYEISSIPRNSTKENQIADFICNFAKKRNLEYMKDKYFNVIVKKRASKGFENRRTIIFQAHTDMVCEKTNDSIHNFEKDGIEIIQSGSVLRARNTTLGADDGIGAVFLLLMLDDNEILHPNIYCLFTTQEEIGMDGARNFDYSNIEADYLINIDGEEEDTAIVGCAGGARIKYEKDIKQELVNENINLYELVISNLKGGHSGADINKGRQNSNYLCASLLEKVEDVRLVSFVGGNKDNAIPNFTKCIFTSHSSKESIESKIDYLLKETKFTEDDKEIKIKLDLLEMQKIKCASKEETNSMINMILNLKQGVLEISKVKEGLVETSGNIGIVKIEHNKAVITELIRSSDDDKRKIIEEYNNNFAINNGYIVKKESDYPGWKYKPNSALEKVYVEAYKQTHNGNKPKIEAIHAGVECGMIYEKMPNLELISIGPDIKDVHTVYETLYLDSCKSILKTIVKMLEML